MYVTRLMIQSLSLSPPLMYTHLLQEQLSFTVHLSHSLPSVTLHLLTIDNFHPSFFFYLFFVFTLFSLHINMLVY